MRSLDEAINNEPVANEHPDFGDVAEYLGGPNQHAAFVRILERYEEVISAVVRRQKLQSADADDLRREIEIRLLKGINVNTDPSRLKLLIISIAHRTSVSFYRMLSRRKRRETCMFDDLRLAQETSDILDQTSLRENNTLLNGLVTQMVVFLPEDERLLVQLFYLQEHTAKEVGAIVDIPPEKVNQRLFRIRRKLREQFLDKFVVL